MRFFVRRTSTGHIDVAIKRTKIFLTAPTALRVTHPLTSILKNCRYLFSRFSIRRRRYTKITRNLSWFLFYLVINHLFQMIRIQNGLKRTIMYFIVHH